MARKVKQLKITYIYAGDESPEKKAESERRLEEAYGIIFDLAAKNIREKKLEQNK